MTAISDLLKIRAEARKLEVPFPSHRSARELEWKDLHEYRGAAFRFGKAVLAGLEKNPPEERAEELGNLHDIALSVVDECDAEFEARENRGSKEPLSQASRPPFAAGIFDAASVDDWGMRDQGASAPAASEWRDQSGNPVRVLGPTERMASEQRGGLTLGHMLRAMVMGPKTPQEHRALAEGSGSTGGFTVPTPLAASFIDSLRAETVVVKAGAKTVPMSVNTLSIVRSAGDPTAAWRAESTAVAESGVTFERITFTANSLAVMVKMSRELFEDSVNAVQALENAFAKGMAVQFDQACLYGTGSGNQPLGIANVSGIGATSMGANGAQMANYDPLIDAAYQLALANAGMPTAHIMAPRTQMSLAKLKDTQGRYLTPPDMVSKVPFLPTTSMPINETQGSASTASSIITGDFTQLMIGMREELRIELYREPLASTLQYMFIAHLRADVQVAHPASFTRLKGILP